MPPSGWIGIQQYIEIRNGALLAATPGSIKEYGIDAVAELATDRIDE